MFSKETFSRRLLELRQEKNESQDALAAFLHVTKTQISEMENAKKTTTLEKFAMICEYYNVSADYLLGLTEERRSIRQESEVCSE